MHLGWTSLVGVISTSITLLTVVNAASAWEPIDGTDCHPMQQHRCFANFTGIAACVPKEGHPNGVYILDDKEKGAGGCPSDKPRCAPKDGIGGNVLWDDWDCIKDSVPTFPPEDKCGKDQKIYVDVQEGLILT